MRTEPSPGLETGFEVREELGRGAFGRVFRALDLALEREVALKVLSDEARVSPEGRERFVEEARVLARLDHPNIVRIHAVDVHEGRIRLSLELIRGRTLQDIVDSDGVFSPEETARIGIDLCRALAALHSRDLVHMDLKPGNVMRAEGGRIVLLDFGFARESTFPAGEEGSPLGGTPAFMSPEHFEYRSDIGPASDIFSLGVLLYWLVSGKFPFAFESIDQLRERVLQGALTPLVDHVPDVPEEFADVVYCAMARQEEDRFPSAGSMERALRDFLGGSQAVAPPAPEAAFGRRWLLAGGIAAAVLGTAAFLGTRGPAGPPPFEVDTRFHLLRDGEELALEGEGEVHAEVRVGDALYVTAEADRPFHFYVFSEDSEGRCYTLFPMESSEQANPLPTAQEHRLPGPAPEDLWVFDTPGGGSEFLFLLASPYPVELGETLAAAVPEPSRREQGVRYADLGRGDREVLLRGIGTHTAEPRPEPVSEEPFGRLVEVFAHFGAQLDPDGEVHYEVLRLRSP